jgi:hypothetical protein
LIRFFLKENPSQGAAISGEKVKNTIVKIKNDFLKE